MSSLWFDMATLAGVIIVGAFSALIDRRARRDNEESGNKLDSIHIEVNSRMQEQIAEVKELRQRLDDLEKQFRNATGHESE